MLGNVNKLKVLRLKKEGEMSIEEGKGRTFKRYRILHHNFQRFGLSILQNIKS